MAQRGMPKQARVLTELLEEREEWRKDVSNFFVATRSVAGMSQSGFAEELDISQPYLSQIERGERTPSSETLGKLRSFVEGSTASGDSNQES
jgi:ribosome-binding protein aMBF1 (putative translation factor)